jgi:hypothetical protein
MFVTVCEVGVWMCVREIETERLRERKRDCN